MADACDRRPTAPISPALDGHHQEADWEHAGCVLSGSVRGCDTAHPCTRLLYGSDHESFYLRFEFREGVQLSRDLPGEIHLLWFYPGVTMYNSPAPLANLPSTAPLNYLFHYHLGLPLGTLEGWFEEAGERYTWQRRDCSARIVLRDYLEIAVPWASLSLPAHYPLRLVAVLAEAGCFQDYLPQGRLLSLQAL